MASMTTRKEPVLEEQMDVDDDAPLLLTMRRELVRRRLCRRTVYGFRRFVVRMSPKLGNPRPVPAERQ